MRDNKTVFTRSLLGCFNAGGRAQRRGEPRVSPYVLVKHSERFRSAWCLGWDKAAADIRWTVADPGPRSRFEKPRTFSRAQPSVISTVLIPLEDGTWKQEKGLVLSYSEHMMLHLFCQGLRNPEVARIINVHSKNVEKRMRALRARFGFEKKRDLINLMRQAQIKHPDLEKL